MEEAEKIILGKGVPKMKISEEQKEYILPPWRMNQIILEVLSVLSEEKYYNEGFDYKQMIRAMGIKIKAFSSFAPENLEEFRHISLSLWNEGVCLVFPKSQTGEVCRMIAYNDEHSASEIMQIILHEFGHLRLHHTQQSINGEVEATCFAIIMTLMLTLEKHFHIGKSIMQTGGKDFLLKSVQNSMSEKEVA